MRFVQPDIAALPELLEAGTDAPPSLETEVTGLFDQFRNPLFRFTLSLGLTEPDSEEIIQEVFLALFQHLRAGKPRDNLRGWLFQVAHNQALKLRQRRPPPVLTPSPAPTPEQQAIANQTHRRVTAVLAALPEQDRSCVALRAEGLRYREIAQILGISLGSVALSLERAAARVSRIHQP
ncbi:MAG TPA: sigma-70 family RNA polymerase sigma factor [Bryobacteraceae bacterium]|nr:sigma-70 family RNA polymerase sigma factor [Bryobacteraceae bacterium]